MPRKLTDALTLVEQTAPATPAAATVVVYAKADGLLYSMNPAGVETLVSGGPGGGTPDPGTAVFDRCAFR